MTTKAVKSRNRYSEAYKIEALALAGKIGVSSAAKQLGLHATQIYSWRQRKQQPTPRQQYQGIIDKRVAAAFFAQKKRAGSPRLVLDLRDQGYSYDRKTVAASMKRQNLRAKAAKKFKA